MTRSPLRWLAVLATATALAAAVTPAAAQQTTTGAIRGRITDEQGLPLPSATVTATNEGTGLARSALADEQGLYIVRLLPPGTYRVAARRIGQQPVELAAVRVTVGTTTPVNVTLRTAVVQLTGVQITAQAAQLDVTDAGVQQVVSQEEIANLPTLGRDFTDFIALSGLVSPNPETTTGGQFSIAGQRPSQTNLQIDGVDANNSFFGENRGGSRVPFAFSLESIREFQIITNGYDVEYGNYSGGIVNIVTRGGTNRLSGTAYGNYRGDVLTRSDFLGNPPEDFNAQQYSARVEGPIIRDKLFFLVSADAQRRREPFRPISSGLLRSEGDTAEADSLDRFLEILETKYGVPNAAAGYQTFQTTDDVMTLFGRLDWTINDRHRLSVRNNFSNHDNLNEAGSFGFDAGISQAESFEDRTNSFVSELTSILGRRMFNVFRVQYALEDRPRAGNELRPTIQVPLTANQQVEYGGTSIAFRNRLDEDKVQVVDNFTIDAGAHSIKVGTNNTFSWFDNVFWFGGSGTYEFPSLARLDSMRPSRYTRSVQADRRAPSAKFDVQEYSIYAQDDWQVMPRLLASIGLRYDISRYGNRPGRVIDVERAFGFGTGVAPIDDNNLSPRISLTYDVRGNATEVVRVGGGLFYGRVPYVMGSNVAVTELPLLTLTCGGQPGDTDAPPSPDYAQWSPQGEDNPFTCAGTDRISGTPSYTFWNHDFEIPETFKANVGYERLITPSLRGSVDVLGSTSRKLYTVRNLNLRDPQFELASEGGRRVFVPEGRFAPSGAAGPDRLRNTDFGNLFVNHNDGVARALAATINLNQRVTEGVTLRGSYTYTNAYDNSSFSCCTATEGFRVTRFGVLGPNVIGGTGDDNAGWGPTDFVRNHTIVLSGILRLPADFRVSAVWRVQSGEPWGPEVQGDINGDGERFNDRPYVFRPGELPVFTGASANPDSVIAANRARYASYLSEHECVGEYVGRVMPRNTCRQPWFSSFDVTVRKRFDIVSGQSLELSVDLFNVLNGLNSSWGRNVEVFGANRNLLTPQQYDAANDQILYTVPTNFGRRQTVGTGLIQQFSAQVGARYSF